MLNRTFNRTTMELKLTHKNELSALSRSFNRTTMELKRGDRRGERGLTSHF